ncbi:MAG: V-type ATP synthase subunit F [Candidatus Methanofastidiosa archaeon]|jgi:vacuolar-type H+-ATPase subunit F/Vma7|nr:V-type ATP synthase subunit F [Candidatus Methanofastidiosa archaeon]MDD4280993.1 V-type ATP synthase subunit F [Candidatus Methanofastidiosa archaeon]
MRTAVIGDEDMVTGFGLIGIKDRYVVLPDRAAAEKVFHEVTSDKNVGIIIISHGVSALIRDLINRTNETKKILPVIIEVPDKGESAAFDPFEDLIKKAVGVSL